MAQIKMAIWGMGKRYFGGFSSVHLVEQYFVFMALIRDFVSGMAVNYSVEAFGGEDVPYMIIII